MLEKHEQREFVSFALGYGRSCARAKFPPLAEVILSEHFLLRSGRRMIVNEGFVAEIFGDYDLVDIP